MKPLTIPVPTALSIWLAAGDRAAEIFDDAVSIDRDWWHTEFAVHDFPDVMHGDTISRRGLFDLGAVSVHSPDDAIALLWNTIAFCQGRRHSDTKQRIAAVAADRVYLGELLQRAAQASREDPAEAFTLLKPDGRNAIDRLASSGFTWFLYFAGGGDAHHPSPVLETRAVRSLRRAGWRDLRQSNWTAADYATYAQVVQRWRAESGAERNDVIVQGLFAVAPPASSDYPWQSWSRTTQETEWANGPLAADDLRQVYHWLALLSDMYPHSSAAHDFSTIGRKITETLDGDLGTGLRLRPARDDLHYDHPYRDDGPDQPPFWDRYGESAC
ncbi:hypothetical protein AAFP30_17030 [Gordonia sp. CPCC 205515]|uniref:8-oxoguanine DNA glycosylase OGG fold protein n=1 Tax=Gordonia sp. CPCC 205515 TaxID=3140791 RepID=UPI003AF3EB76